MVCAFKMLIKQRFAQYSSKQKFPVVTPKSQIPKGVHYTCIKTLVMCFLVYPVSLKLLGASSYPISSVPNLFPPPCPQELPSAPVARARSHIHHTSATGEGNWATHLV